MKSKIYDRAASLIKEKKPDFKYLISKISIILRFKYYSDPIVVDTMYISSGDESLREFVYKSYLNKNLS